MIVDHEIYGEEDDNENDENPEENDITEDDGFEDIILMNTSLEKLYECLLAYREFLDKHILENSIEYKKEFEI